MKTLTISLLLLTSVCFSQDPYQDLKKLPKPKYLTAVSDSIKKLEGSSLGNFVYHITENDSAVLESLDSILIEKLNNSKWAYDIHLISAILLEKKSNKIEVEKALSKTKSIWDKDNWSKKVWKLIRDNNLNISNDVGYSVDNNGLKTYNIEVFINDKISKGDIGENPALMIDSRPTTYESGQLIQYLKTLNIKEISVFATKEKAPQLYGKRGIDGALSVLTR